jgi:ATP-binding cassette subfamily B protein
MLINFNSLIRLRFQSLINGLSKKRRIIFYFTKGNERLVWKLTFLTFFSGFVDMVSVASVLPVLQAGMDSLDTATSIAGKESHLSLGINFVATNLSLSPLVAAGLFLVIISTLTFAFKIYYAHFSQVVANRIMTEHKQKLFNLISKADYAQFILFGRGELVHLYTISANGISITIDYLTRLFSQIITVLFLLILMFLTVPKFIVPIIIIGLFYSIFSRIFIKNYVEKGSLQLNQLKSNELHILNEFIAGSKPIRLSGGSMKWQEKITKNLLLSSKFAIRIFLGFSAPSILMQFILGISISVLALYMSRLSSSEIITFVPAIGVFVLAASRLNSAISSASNSYSAIINHFPQITNIYDFLKKTREVNDLGAIVKKEFIDNIRFEDVSFVYDGRNIPVLSNFSMEIKKGHRIGIVGASGAGKSTILNLLLRLFEPKKGFLSIDNQPIRNIRLEDYYGLFSMVSQDSFLLHDSIIENICFGSQFTLEQVLEAAKLADANDFIQSFPNSYQTIVGDNGVQLSGGQRQRIAIARAVIRKPQILILDEPTSALDSSTEKKIMETINNLDIDLTIIMITHNRELLSHFDQVIEL